MKLQFGLTLLVALAFVSCSKKEEVPLAHPVELRGAMEYVTICRSPSDCRKVSRLAMGTDHLIQGGWTGEGQAELTEEEAFKVLDEASRLGINFYDTSPIYVGDVEHRLGKWKKSRKAEAHILSKGGFPFDLFWAKKLEKGTHSLEFTRELEKQKILLPNAKAEPDGTILLTDVPPGTYASRLFGSKEQITERVADELKHTITNLNGDIAIYLMHRDDGDAIRFKAVPRVKTPVKTILQGISAPTVAKNFWGLGWSNWETDRVNESRVVSGMNPELLKPLINSPYFSLFEMSERSIHALGLQVTHAEMMDPNFQKGIKIMPYSPLGGFSILDKPEPKWENAKKSAKEKFEKGDPYWQNVFHAIFTDANEKRWHRVVEFTKRFNTKNGTEYTVDQMINAYALAHPRTDMLAIGAITVEQLRRTVKSLELSKLLTVKDLNYLYSGN